MRRGDFLRNLVGLPAAVAAAAGVTQLQFDRDEDGVLHIDGDVRLTGHLEVLQERGKPALTVKPSNPVPVPPSSFGNISAAWTMVVTP